MLIDSKLTLQINEAIKFKKWDIIEEVLNSRSLQSYHPSKIAAIGLCLLEELKKTKGN